ncbi:LysR family transcriptional regulator [Labrys monachus]|uniref:DNA-binding transcriptional LysR family regulator n=1 Tax=Labrys monachus TaxID=217067 RepID=A0ABU0FIY0_9HYPH|nr:LysR family transcriptional regulator [Labrys monachus]MDQ0394441.1 DNA-binding transcriptional LysR family regulator [Labrys monachus]
MDLRALADFNLVATHGGLGRASRASGQSKATLSRHIAELEDSLGVRLLERGSRSSPLTEEGAALHARTEGLLREIAEAGETVGAGIGRPRGRLRVSAPMLLSHIALGRIAAEFSAAYPEVRLEITAEDRFVDPIEEGYDVVIRINPAPDDRLIGRCFLRDEMMVVAPPSMARPSCLPGRAPTVPAVVLSTTAPGATWRMRRESGSEDLMPDPILRLSSLLMVRDAVLARAGAALLPRSMVARDLAAARLSCWGVVDDRPVAAWALHVSRRLVSSRVTAFIEALVAAFPDQRL